MGKSLSSNKLEENAREMSDHNPLILRSDLEERKKSNHFCFETSWIKHPDYHPKLVEIWGREVRAKKMQWRNGI
jgi:hypothetical protein